MKLYICTTVGDIKSFRTNTESTFEVRHTLSTICAQCFYRTIAVLEPYFYHTFYTLIIHANFSKTTHSRALVSLLIIQVLILLHSLLLGHCYSYRSSRRHCSSCSCWCRCRCYSRSSCRCRYALQSYLPALFFQSCFSRWHCFPVALLAGIVLPVACCCFSRSSVGCHSPLSFLR